MVQGIGCMRRRPVGARFGLTAAVAGQDTPDPGPDSEVAAAADSGSPP
jgi:hypothetical protein